MSDEFNSDYQAFLAKLRCWLPIWKKFLLLFIFVGQFRPLPVDSRYSVQYQSYKCGNSTDIQIQGQIFLISMQ